VNWQGWGSGRGRNSGNVTECTWTEENETGFEAGRAVSWLRFEDSTARQDGRKLTNGPRPSELLNLPYFAE